MYDAGLLKVITVTLYIMYSYYTNYYINFLWCEIREFLLSIYCNV